MSTNDANAQASIPKWQIRTSWVISGLLFLQLLASASAKLLQPGDFLDKWSKDYPASSARPLGIIELACIVMHLVPRTQVFGTALLTAYLGGAVATHVHKGEWLLVFAVLVGVLAWIALWLRNARLRQLFPLTKDRI